MSENQEEGSAPLASAALLSKPAKKTKKMWPKKLDNAKAEESSGDRVKSGHVARIAVVTGLQGQASISIDLTGKKGRHSIAIDPAKPTADYMLALANSALVSGAKLHVKAAEAEGGASYVTEMEVRTKR